MRVLKRKARTEVGGWIYSSKCFWSWVINFSFEMRHWQMGEVLGNSVRSQSVHSELEYFFRTASHEWVSMCIVILTTWLSMECLKHLAECSEIIKMCPWTVQVHSDYSRQRGPHECAVTFTINLIYWLSETNRILKNVSNMFSRGSSET